MLLILAIAYSIYLFIDILERADLFIIAEVPLFAAISYFGARMPAIIATLLPAVFLLASVICLCQMARMRETIALSAGGVSPVMLAVIMLVCGIYWGLIQLGTSQILGNLGDAYAERLWNEDVRKRTSISELRNVWFGEEKWLVNLAVLNKNGDGTGLVAYCLDEVGATVTEIVRAKSFLAAGGVWRLEFADILYPADFTFVSKADLTLPLHQDPAIFFMTMKNAPNKLPLWDMSKIIRQLSGAGSNVEGLVTIWHSRLAYAASTVVMALLAVAIISFTTNIYLGTGLSLVCIFVYYACGRLAESIGSQGAVPPVAAVWAVPVLIVFLSCLRIIYTVRKR